MKCFCAAGMSTSIGLGFSDAHPKSRRTKPSDTNRATMCSSCRVSECAAEYGRRDFLSSATWWLWKKYDGAGAIPRRHGRKRRAKRALVAGGLSLVEPIGRVLEVEVQLLPLEEGPAVLEGDLVGRILRLR